MTSTVTLVLIVLAVLLLLAVVGLLVARQRKRKGLQDRFGPEYDRTVEGGESRRDAERELTQRAERRDELDIKPLDPQRRDAYAAEWRSTQEAFVDQPAAAVADANDLVERVMQERGYPAGDFEQMSRDVSVDHAGVVQEYRAAHEIAELNDRREASTEQLRQAMVHYRSLFGDLLDAGDHDRHGAASARTEDEGGPGDERDRESGRR